MNTKTKHGCRRMLAMLLVIVSVMSLFAVPAFAGQEDGYHDPAERWMNASNRTNELDVNATVTHETFHCYACGQATSFQVWRTPEYTKDGQTALARNVRYSDGTLVGGSGTGTILDGTPGVNATYTGYHWTKACCETCGTMNANMGVSDYCFSKNVYWLYDCTTAFTEQLDDVVTYEYADATYHKKIVDGGNYCEFCYGTRHTHSETLEPHDLHVDILPQIANQRFAIVKHCHDCEYTSYDFVAAKAVVADYYGVVDGQAHTLTISDLSEAGVNAVIRYGNTAETCTMTAPPSYTEEGQYTVYYQITYSYQGVSMTENGVAYVWLRDESAPDLDDGTGCKCGCGKKDCDCEKGTCPNCKDKDCSKGDHNYILIETVRPTCDSLGYDRYICTICGMIEKRNYVNAIGHAWQSVLVREADCSNGGKVLDICRNCGTVKETVTPKGEHSWTTYNVSATCTMPGYTVKECSKCGERQITNLTAVLGHNYKAYVTPATCVTGGKTVYVCDRCGDAYVGGYSDAKGHRFDSGTVKVKPSCTGEGLKEYTCLDCGYKYSETLPAAEHKHGAAATCTEPELCTVCGAVLENAHGHSFQEAATEPTCEKMGYSVFTCAYCGETFKGDYTDALGHDYKAVVTAPTCNDKGFTTYTCTRCGDSYVTDYVDALGHEWDEGRKLISTSCNGEGLIDHRCVRCDYHYLEAVSPEGHNPGPEADCIHPQICLDCGAVLVQAKGHNYVGVVTEPTCTEMGYTTYTCEGCGDSYKSDYTRANGHKEGDWIIDKEPTTDAEGQRHKVCTVCGETLITETIEKLYNMATTDSKGEAVVGGYLVIVTDTDTKNPIANATVVLNKDGTISVRLPDGRILDYADQTTVTVLLNKDKTPVKELLVVVTDRNGNYSAEKTDVAGQITVPGTSGVTGPDGKVTIGWIDADGNRYTITLKVVDYENGRPIEGAAVTIGKTGNITVTLPDGIDIDAANRILLLLTDNLQKPLPGWTIIVKGDKDTETGKTDEDGILIVPESIRQEKHGAYIVGYPDGTFGPERSMTRSEATAIFARLLAERKGDTIVPVERTKFEDIPANAWYSGYAKYLNNYGVVYGTEEGKFSPDKPITRAEFVAMAVRFFEVYGDGNPVIMEQYAEFNDVSDGYWAAEYIKDAAIYGWVKGYGDGTFRASQEITRAEVVTIVNRLLDRTADAAYIAKNLSDLNTFSDMEKTHWAYYAVMEAANAHTATFDKEEAWSK